MRDDFINISFSSPVKICRQNILLAMKYAAKKYAMGSLVDMGCGTKPYFSVFHPYIDTYLGIDFPPTAMLNYGQQTRADIFADCSNTPLKSNSYDTVLSTQVMEHIYDTRKYITECHRLLKKGGFGIFTVPFLWPCHGEPFDYFRFTKYGIEEYFKDQAFQVVEIRPLEGAYASVIQTKIIACYLTPSQHIFIKLWKKLILLVYVPILNFLALHLDRHFYNDKLCLNYLAIVRK